MNLFFPTAHFAAASTIGPDSSERVTLFHQTPSYSRLHFDSTERPVPNGTLWSICRQRWSEQFGCSVLCQSGRSGVKDVSGLLAKLCFYNMSPLQSQSNSQWDPTRASVHCAPSAFSVIDVCQRQEWSTSAPELQGDRGWQKIVKPRHVWLSAGKILYCTV